MIKKPTHVCGIKVNDEDLYILGWIDFVQWADAVGIGEHPDDYGPWFSCWIQSRIALKKQYEEENKLSSQGKIT